MCPDFRSEIPAAIFGLLQNENLYYSFVYWKKRYRVAAIPDIQKTEIPKRMDCIFTASIKIRILISE